MILPKVKNYQTHVYFFIIFCKVILNSVRVRKNKICENDDEVMVRHNSAVWLKSAVSSNITERYLYIYINSS